MANSSADNKASLTALRDNDEHAVAIDHVAIDETAMEVDLTSDLLERELNSAKNSTVASNAASTETSAKAAEIKMASASPESFASTHLDIETLRAFVPLNILSDDHLATLARTTERELLMRGQSVVDIEELKNCQIFLLSGCVMVEDAEGVQSNLFGGSNSSHLSIGDRFQGVKSILAIEDSRLLVLERDKLDAMLCWDQVAKTLAVEYSADRHLDEDLDWMNTLLCSNLFHKIPPYNVKHIVDQFEARVVQSGEAIVRQGEHGDVCYIIKDGHAVVTVTSDAANSDNVGGRDANRETNIVAQLGPGKCFGEDALLNKTTRNATVTMESNGVVMCLKKRDFLALMAEPEVATVTAKQAEVSVASGAQWLDVRSQQEYDNSHKDDAFHLPMHLMTLKSRLMDSDKEYIAYCSTGRRASTVAYLLSQQGFKVLPLAG